MDDEKITIDRKTFKTLSSKTRINILKSLDKRRKTLSELSKESNMSVSTLSEHLGKLSNADLVVKKDDGHKWKYYELSRKGRGIMYPETKKIWIMLSVSIIAILVMGTDLFRNYGVQTMKSVDEVAISADSLAASVTTPLPWFHIVGILVFVGLLAAGLILLYRKGKIF